MKKRSPIRFTIVRNRFKKKPSTKKATRRAAAALPIAPSPPRKRGWITLPADKNAQARGVDWLMTPDARPRERARGRYVWP